MQGRIWISFVLEV